MAKKKQHVPSFQDAEELFGEGDFEAALAVCDEILTASEGPAVEVRWLAAECLLQLQEPGEALHLLEEAIEAEPDHPALLLAQGVALFELFRLDEAKGALEKATKEEPDLGDAWYYLGLVAEFQGDEEAANRSFAQAVEKDPEHLVVPHDWSAEEVRTAWGELCSDLPAPMGPWLGSLPVQVHDRPDRATLVREEENISPLVHCLFLGTPQASAEGEDPALWFQAKPKEVRVYRRSLGRSAMDEHELREELLEAMIWESMEFLGLDNDQAQALGLLSEDDDDDEHPHAH